MEQAVKIEIERAGAADARLLAALGTVTFYEAYFEQDTPQDMAAYLAESFAVEKIEAEMADPNADFFIAYRDRKAVGYAKMLRGTTADGVGGAGAVELKRFYLVERVWGTGVADRLLEHCVAFARDGGHDSLWLGVWQENERGRGFYAKHGFHKVGTIEFPYGETIGINDVLELNI